jgi:hypothetical protein
MKIAYEAPKPQATFIHRSRLDNTLNTLGICKGYGIYRVTIYLLSNSSELEPEDRRLLRISWMHPSP